MNEFKETVPIWVKLEMSQDGGKTWHMMQFQVHPDAEGFTAEWPDGDVKTARVFWGGMTSGSTSR